MTRFVGLDVSQKITAICVVDDAGGRLWRGQCPTNPEQINILVRRHAGDDARIGIETGAMTPWLVHELRNLGLEVVCLDARHARAALKMQINKTDQNDAEGLARSFAPDGNVRFTSSRSKSTAHVLFLAQGLNSSA
jgi:transposase